MKPDPIYRNFILRWCENIVPKGPFRAEACAALARDGRCTMCVEDARKLFGVPPVSNFVKPTDEPELGVVNLRLDFEPRSAYWKPLIEDHIDHLMRAKVPLSDKLESINHEIESLMLL